MIIPILCVIVLQLISIIQPFWSQKTGHGQGVSYRVNMGLWKQCGKGTINNTNIDKCNDINMKDANFPKKSLLACRGLAIAGASLIFLAGLCVLFCKQHKKIQMMLLLLGGLAIIASDIVWHKSLLNFKDANGVTTDLDPGYCMWLNMVGGVVALFSSAIVVWTK